MQIVMHFLTHGGYDGRMSTPAAATRKSVPLAADELALAREVRTPGTPERAAVEALVGPLPERLSESQALAALMSVAQTSIREHVSTSGYAAYAAALDDEDRAYAAANRARRSEHARRRREDGRE